MKSIKRLIREQLDNMSNLMIKYEREIKQYIDSLPESNINKRNPKNINEVIGLRFDNGGNSIDSDIIGFKNLKEIIAKNCGLTTLPENIGNLTKLESLIVVGNNITSLPDSICNLQNLNFINLIGSDLTHVPDCISNLDFNNGGNLMVFSLQTSNSKIRQKLERLVPNADIN